MRRVALTIALATACGTPPPGPAPRRGPIDLTTEAEQSGLVRTGRHAEAVRLCEDFAAAHPGRARCQRYGTTPEGRPLVALAVSSDGVLDPEAARRARRPVLMVQAGIHAGEIEGKDGGFIALRELLAGEAAPGALAAATLVFVPVVNPDGHERFGRHQRPNQRGPEEGGFRTTARNLNLNRDYVKADAAEMRALLALFAAWDPVVYVDLHTTDGAKFRHDVAVITAPWAPHPAGLEREARALSDAFQARLAALEHLPLAFYPSFEEEDRPESGFTHGDAPPRFSQAYAATRGRLGVLVETHSWQPYAARVKSMRDVIVTLAERAVSDAAAWRAAADRADRALAALAGREVTLSHQPDGAPRTIEFLGYAYTRQTSEISGQPWIVYDETRPEVWRVPLVDGSAPRLTVRAPGAGFLVPLGWVDEVRPVLEAHGLAFRVVGDGHAEDARVFRAREVEHGAAPYEGRQTAKVTGAWAVEPSGWPAGSIFVPVAQPGALLVLTLFSPEAPDSLVGWGFFNAVFEQKEYMEAYVVEAEARRMLAADPELARAFAARLAADPAFAASPRARLAFFYQRHPAFDDRLNRVPVLALDSAP